MADEEQEPLAPGGEPRKESPLVSPAEHRRAIIHEVKWLVAGTLALLAVGVTLGVLVTVLPEAPKPAIWIDTDVGQDDMMAITMLLKNTVTSRWILGMSTVFGNAHTYNATVNLHRLLQAVNRTDIAVVSGVDLHFAGGHSFPDWWFPGCDAMVGLTLPPVQPFSPSTVSAARAIINAAAARPGIQLLAIGPLTNIAVAAILGGDAFASNVGNLVIMGGAVSVAGNVFPANVSEWNIYGDPVAADVVLRTLAAKTTVVPLDAVEDVSCSPEFLQKVCIPPIAPDAATQLMCQAVTVLCTWNDDGFADPVAAAVLLDPGLYRFQPMPLRINTTDGLASGRTFIDPLNGTSVRVATAVTSVGFADLLAYMADH